MERDVCTSNSTRLPDLRQSYCVVEFQHLASFPGVSFGFRENMDEKLLILWDDFSGHWIQEVVDYADSKNVMLMKVPPRYTYVCQPADVAWNQPPAIQEQAAGSLAGQPSLTNCCPPRNESDRTDPRRKFAEQVAAIARKEMQEVAKEKISCIQVKAPSSAFVMVVPKRVDIASWISESWKELSAKMITGGFVKADLLCDTRSVETEDELSGIDQITDLLDHLGELGAVG